MSDWVWVAWGFGVTYCSLFGYFALLHRRRSRLRRQLREQR